MNKFVPDIKEQSYGTDNVYDLLANNKKVGHMFEDTGYTYGQSVDIDGSFTEKYLEQYLNNVKESLTKLFPEAKEAINKAQLDVATFVYRDVMQLYIDTVAVYLEAAEGIFEEIYKQLGKSITTDSDYHSVLNKMLELEVQVKAAIAYLNIMTDLAFDKFHSVKAIINNIIGSLVPYLPDSKVFKDKYGLPITA